MLRIMTANLYKGRVTPATVTSLIRAHRPDVLAVQELVPAVAQVLAAEMPHGALEPRPRGPSIGLALLRPARVERLRLRSHEGLVARLDPDEWPALERPLDVIGVHLPAPNKPPLLRSAQLRAADVRMLSAYLAQPPDGGRVLVGDLNSTPSFPLYRRLRRFLVDAAELGADSTDVGPAPTWGLSPDSAPLLRLDHVLVSGVEVVASRTVAIDGSDHNAVLVDLAVLA